MHPRRRPGGPRVDILLARDVSDDAIVELARDATVTGIDSPFGWPRPFTDAIAAYAAGAAWPRQKPDGLWFRLTDLRARAIAGGRPPLSVSSGRIARPAERAARLLILLGTRDRAARRDGADGVIEVYPAGALRCWGIAIDGYQRSDGSAVRTRIADSIVEQLELSLSSVHRDVLHCHGPRHRCLGCEPRRPGIRASTRRRTHGQRVAARHR